MHLKTTFLCLLLPLLSACSLRLPDKPRQALTPAPTAPRVVSPAAAINPPRIEPTTSPIPTQTEANFSTPDATQAANITAYGLTFYSDVDKFSVVFPVMQSLNEHWVDMEIQGEKVNCRLLFAPDNGAFWEVQVCDLPPATLILWGDGLVLEAISGFCCETRLMYR